MRNINPGGIESMAEVLGTQLGTFFLGTHRKSKVRSRLLKFQCPGAIGSAQVPRPGG